MNSLSDQRAPTSPRPPSPMPPMPHSPLSGFDSNQPCQPGPDGVLLVDGSRGTSSTPRLGPMFLYHFEPEDDDPSVFCRAPNARTPPGRLLQRRRRRRAALMHWPCGVFVTHGLVQNPWQATLAPGQPQSGSETHRPDHLGAAGASTTGGGGQQACGTQAAVAEWRRSLRMLERDLPAPVTSSQVLLRRETSRAADAGGGSGDAGRSLVTTTRSQVAQLTASAQHHPQAGSSASEAPDPAPAAGESEASGGGLQKLSSVEAVHMLEWLKMCRAICTDVLTSCRLSPALLERALDHKKWLTQQVQQLQQRICREQQQQVQQEQQRLQQQEQQESSSDYLVQQQQQQQVSNEQQQDHQQQQGVEQGQQHILAQLMEELSLSESLLQRMEQLLLSADSQQPLP